MKRKQFPLHLLGFGDFFPQSEAFMCIGCSPHLKTEKEIYHSAIAFIFYILSS